ncbi:MAG: hypothetical protein L6R39_006096, partial [Caloplaca ligustica]
SSLLNVGMRIRKSVPEGYKTKPQTKAKTQIRYASSLSSIDQDQGGDGVDGFNGQGSGGGYVELVPYCGMMKTGGFGVQSQEEEEVDVPLPGTWFECAGLPSHQDPVGEQAGNGPMAGRGKRRFVDDEEEESNKSWQGGETDGRRVRGSTEDVQASSILALRPIAQARNRRPPTTSMRKSTGDGDFEEATFLRDVEECMEFD